MRVTVSAERHERGRPTLKLSPLRVAEHTATRIQEAVLVNGVELCESCPISCFESRLAVGSDSKLWRARREADAWEIHMVEHIPAHVARASTPTAAPASQVSDSVAAAPRRRYATTRNAIPTSSTAMNV